MIAADLEADFDRARATGRTTDPPTLHRNPEPQDLGVAIFAAAAQALLDAGPVSPVAVPGHRCDRCQVAWSGPAPCWVCGNTAPLVVGSRRLWVARTTG